MENADDPAGLLGDVLDLVDAAVAQITDEQVQARMLDILTDTDRRASPQHLARRFAELRAALPGP